MTRFQYFLLCFLAQFLLFTKGLDLETFIACFVSICWAELAVKVYGRLFKDDFK